MYLGIYTQYIVNATNNNRTYFYECENCSKLINFDCYNLFEIALHNTYFEIKIDNTFNLIITLCPLIRLRTQDLV